MKKIPPGSEASNILVGEVDFLEKPVTAFVRLSQGATLGDMTEVPVPTRFLFLMLGPKVSFHYFDVNNVVGFTYIVEQHLSIFLANEQCYEHYINLNPEQNNIIRLNYSD